MPPRIRLTLCSHPVIRMISTAKLLPMIHEPPGLIGGFQRLCSPGGRRSLAESHVDRGRSLHDKPSDRAGRGRWIGALSRDLRTLAGHIACRKMRCPRRIPRRYPASICGMVQPKIFQPTRERAQREPDLWGDLDRSEARACACSSQVKSSEEARARGAARTGPERGHPREDRKRSGNEAPGLRSRFYRNQSGLLPANNTVSLAPHSDTSTSTIKPRWMLSSCGWMSCTSPSSTAFTVPTFLHHARPHTQP